MHQLTVTCPFKQPQIGASLAIGLYSPRNSIEVMNGTRPSNSFRRMKFFYIISSIKIKVEMHSLTPCEKGPILSILCLSEPTRNKIEY